MRHLSTKIFIPLLAILFFSIGCKKKDVIPPAPAFTSFSIQPSANPGITTAIAGVITNKEIALRIPNVLNITQVIPSFETNQTGTIVYVGNDVQQSGTTVKDLSQPVTYRIVTQNGSEQYTVKALRNAAILSLGFYKEDNPGVLFKDYEATINGLSIKADVPVDANVKQLVARFTTTPNAVAKVNGVTQVTKVTVNDYSNPVTFDLTDNETTTPEKFVITIGRLTAPQWSAMSLGNLSTATVSGLRMAINPVTNYPSIVYALPSSAVGGVETARKAVAAAFDGTNWNYLGPAAGFSTGRVDLPAIDYTKTGVLYAAYKDYDGDKAQNASVKKFENGNWNYVGAQTFTDHRVNYLSLSVDTDDQPVIGYVLARADAGMINRAPYTYKLINNVWTGIGIPAITTAFFARTLKGNDGKVYYVAMDMTVSTAERRPTVYRLSSNNTWQLVGSALVSPSPEVVGAILIDIAVAKDGTVYLAFQSQANTDKKSYVMKSVGNSWQLVGDVFNHTAGSNAERDNIALAVHPNGTLFFAHGDANGLNVTTLNTQTNNWNPDLKLRTQRIDKIDLKISADGIPYLATCDTETGALLMYKYDIPK